jgi:hypothetical protein
MVNIAASVTIHALTWLMLAMRVFFLVARTLYGSDYARGITRGRTPNRKLFDESLIPPRGVESVRKDERVYTGLQPRGRIAVGGGCIARSTESGRSRAEESSRLIGRPQFGKEVLDMPMCQTTFHCRQFFQWLLVASLVALMVAAIFGQLAGKAIIPDIPFTKFTLSNGLVLQFRSSLTYFRSS